MKYFYTNGNGNTPTLIIAETEDQAKAEFTMMLMDNDDKLDDFAQAIVDETEILEFETVLGDNKHLLR